MAEVDQVKDNDPKYRMMTGSPVFGLVMRLSIPTTFSMLVTTIYNLADTYFVSGIGNSAAVAVGVVFSIQSIIQAIGYGFGMGAQSLISRKLGEQKKKEADLYGTSGFVAAFLMGIVIMIFGLLNLKWLMRLFGSTETALPYACEYGRLILIGAPVFCSSFVLNNILRAEGRATLSMIGLCSGSVINIGLDYYLIRCVNMGISGAALATIISQAISFVILVIFFLSGKSTIKVNPLHTSRNFRDYVTVFRVGLPTVFRQSLGSLATTLLNHAVRTYGDTTMAAVTIAGKVYMLLRSMLIGVGQGFQPVAGYNYGAKKFGRVREAFKAGVIIGTVYGLLATAILFLFPREIVGLFRKGDAEVIEIGSRMLRFFCLALPVLAYSTFVNQLYQSLGFVFSATLLASCRQGIFFVPLILILPRAFGLTGIQITQAVADLMTFLISIPYQILMYKKYLYVRKEGRY